MFHMLMDHGTEESDFACGSTIWMINLSVYLLMKAHNWVLVGLSIYLRDCTEYATTPKLSIILKYSWIIINLENLLIKGFTN